MNYLLSWFSIEFQMVSISTFRYEYTKDFSHKRFQISHLFFLYRRKYRKKGEKRWMIELNVEKREPSDFILKSVLLFLLLLSPISWLISLAQIQTEKKNTETFEEWFFFLFVNLFSTHFTVEFCCTFNDMTTLFKIYTHLSSFEIALTHPTTHI